MISKESLMGHNVFGSVADRDNYLHACYGRACRTVEAFTKHFNGGPVLEIGANPYFITLMVMGMLPRAKMTLTNWFGTQTLAQCMRTGALHREGNAIIQSTGKAKMAFYHFNVEDASSSLWKLWSGHFGHVFFCEILEHLLVEPRDVIARISGLLKPKGLLILSTPNVFSAENKRKWAEGKNIFDTYSPNGPHGRHNRLWAKYEVEELLAPHFRIGSIEMPDAASGEVTEDGDTILVAASKK